MTRTPDDRAPLPTVLLTGFEPFGDETCNPSWDAVVPLDGLDVGGHRIVVRRLPVEFGASLDVLRAAIEETAPALVVCVGLAGGRTQLSLERIGINVDDARIPDNAGAQPVDVPVAVDGPAAYFATLPIKAMLLALRAAGIPAEISQSAGTYVCNHVLYGLLHALRDRPDVRGGFIHVPFSPAQAACHPGAPSLPTATVGEGLKVAIEAALATGHDIRFAAGTTH